MKSFHWSTSHPPNLKFIIQELNNHEWVSFFDHWNKLAFVQQRSGWRNSRQDSNLATRVGRTHLSHQYCTQNVAHILCGMWNNKKKRNRKRWRKIKNLFEAGGCKDEVAEWIEVGAALEDNWRAVAFDFGILETKFSERIADRKPFVSRTLVCPDGVVKVLLQMQKLKQKLFKLASSHSLLYLLI